MPSASEFPESRNGRSSRSEAHVTEMTRELKIGDLVQKVQSYYPVADVSLIRKAYDFSATVHQGQKRLSGEPYLVHPLAVADIIADLKLDVPSIAGGLLHDTVEDTLTTLDEVKGI